MSETLLLWALFGLLAIFLLVALLLKGFQRTACFHEWKYTCCDKTGARVFWCHKCGARDWVGGTKGRRA